MNIKKITSLTMLWSMLILTYTGVMLFIAPHGKVANWGNWKLFGLSKGEFGDIHSTFMVLFVVMTILHLYYNWKPITSYMKNKAKEMIVLTKDMFIATLISIAFIVGTLTNFSPFSNLLEFGDDIKISWEKEYGVAPYSKAELSSLKTFCKKLGFNLEESKELLKIVGISFQQTQTLKSIAEENAVSPQFIYELLKNDLKKEGKTIQLTKMGKKTISEVAQTLHLKTGKLLEKLKALGIEAKKDDKLKKTTEKYDMTPTEVLKKLGYEQAV